MAKQVTYPPRFGRTDVAGLTGLVFLVLLVGFSLYDQWQDTHVTTVAAATTPVSTTPGSPTLTPQAGPTAEGQDLQALNYFTELVKTHDHPYVRDWLWHKIDDGTVAVSPSRLGEGNHVAAVILRLMEDGSEVPLMGINPELLLDKSTSREYVQLVILHETVHMREMLRRRDANESLDMFRIGPPRTAAIMRETFFGELDAFKVECEYAQSKGWQSRVNICEHYNSNDLTEFYLTILTQYAPQPSYQAHIPLMKGWVEEYLKNHKQ